MGALTTIKVKGFLLFVPRYYCFPAEGREKSHRLSRLHRNASTCQTRERERESLTLQSCNFEEQTASCKNHSPRRERERERERERDWPTTLRVLSHFASCNINSGTDLARSIYMLMHVCIIRCRTVGDPFSNNQLINSKLNSTLRNSNSLLGAKYPPHTLFVRYINFIFGLGSDPRIKD